MPPNSSLLKFLTVIAIATFIAGCQTGNVREPVADAAHQELDETAEPMTAADPNLNLDEQNEAEQISSDLWEQTRENFQLSTDYSDPRLNNHLQWFIKHPEYLDRVTARASRYYHYILNEIIKRDMPTEIALLPVIESGYDPFAYSSGKAAGAWQFIPSTGEYFGLKNSWWYDGRRDIIASTDAALNYLEKLHKRFEGDWLLALAAYNAGGGNVSRAIRRNTQKGKPVDFWSLPLPEETRQYVPKLLALAKVVKSPEEYNISLTHLPDEPYFEIIETESQIDLAKVADFAGISTKEIYLLNPGFRRWATDPNGPHRLLLPTGSASLVEEKLSALPAEERVRWEQYTIKKGDNLGAIASRFNTPVSTIREANKLKSNQIVAGHTLLIPIATYKQSDFALNEKQLAYRHQKTVSRINGKKAEHYPVKAGDTLWSIAKNFNVNVNELARWNNLNAQSTLSIGKVLSVWDNRSTLPIAAKKIDYQVKQGDSFFAIAERYKLNIDNILAWNQLNAANYLQPGQKLTLYVSSEYL